MPVKETLHRWWTYLPPILAVLALVHPVLSLMPRWDWRFDLVSHFREPGLVLTLLAAASLFPRRRRPAVAFLILATLQAEPILRYSLPNPVQPANTSGPRLRILMANVLVDNDNYAALASLIRDVRPDVVGLVEVSEEWIAGLADVAKEYPYRLEAPDGPRGLALWFKQPPIRIDPPARPTIEGWPYLHATFSFAGKTRQLWLLHPASPTRRWGRFRGFPELDAIADRISAAEGSRIVLGDMNTTDGSPHFHDFLAKTGLRDSRLGFGRQPSWPVGLPYQITIDHAFVSDDLAVIARRQGPSIGSDHWPMWLDLAPAEAKASKNSSAHPSASAR